MNIIRQTTRDAAQTGTGDIFGGASGRPERSPIIVAIMAAIASAIIVWWPTQSLALGGGFAGAGLLAAATIWGTRGRRLETPSGVVDVNDWSLVRAVADADDVGVAITERTGRLVCANDQYCDWFGGAVTPPNLPVDPATVALLAAAGRAAWRDGEAAVAAFEASGREMTGTVRRVGRSNDHLLWRWSVHSTADPVTDAANAVGGIVGQMLGESGIMAALVTSAGTIRSANSAFRLRAGGGLQAKLEGHDFAATLRIDSNGLIRFARERDGEGSTPLRIIEVPFNRAAQNSPLMLFLIDEDGGATERGIALDYVESLLTTLPFGLAMVDRDGRFLFINGAFARAAGLPVGAQPSYPSDLVVADDKGAIGEAVRRYAGGRGGSGDIAVRMRDRPDDPITVGLVGVRGMGDAAVLLSLKETGGERNLDHDMTQATKMQAVGQLAGGIAHDFNNVLTAILGSCDLMLLRHSPGDSDYDDVQQVRSNANRAANLTRQLLAFSRQQTLRPQILNLSDIVADVSHLLERLIGERVRLVVQHGRGLGPVRADPVQLEQVIVNLGINARDAMPFGGTLTITTRAIVPDEAAALALTGMPPGHYSLLSVTDSGSGIAPDVLPKIFEPFFTTKDLGKGTGLGLATVYGIVKQSGGYIFARSEPGQGASFDMYLPVYTGSETPEAPVAPATARSLHWGSGTILLVEDEDMVRAVAERALVRAGYTVVTAAHGEDGMAKFAEMDSVDLIISDVMMPTMDGPTMVQAIRKRRGDLPVLFMSGYAEEQLRESIGLPNVAFLAKPFSVAQLTDAVATIRSG